MTTAPAIQARRRDVVERLLDRGLTARVLEALLPGWEQAIADAVAARPNQPSCGP